MIGKLKGKVDLINYDHAIIDVGGVGYLVFCSAKTLAGFRTGEFTNLFIETHVREDHIHLYGFCSIQEKESFILLQSVKGVGARMSLSILSILNPEDIAYALATKNISAFVQVSGVGKKLAERIITELKDKYASNSYTTGKLAISGSGNMETVQNPEINNLALDAISALVSLGVTRADAQNRVSTLLARNNEMTLSELIRLALRN